MCGVCISLWLCIPGSCPVSITWGPTICQKEGLSVEDVCPPTKKFLVVTVCVSSCWGEVIWKPPNISAGIFPSPFGNRQQRLSGEISFALSQSEKFLRGILVLGMRNQTQLIPSGPMPLIKPTEVQFSWSRLRPWGGAGAVQFREFHLWLRPFPDSETSLRFQGIVLPACKQRE